MIRLFRVSIPTSVFILILFESALLFGCLLFSSFLVLGEETDLFLLYEAGITRLGIVVISVLFAFYFQDLYSAFKNRTAIQLAQDCVSALGLAVLVQSLVAYLFPEWIAPRWVLLVGGLMFLILFPLCRLGYESTFMPAIGSQIVLFLGANSLAQELARRFQERPELGMHPVGFVDDDYEPGTVLGTLPVLGCVEEFSAIVERVRAHYIIVGMTERRQRLPLEDLLRLRFSGMRIEEAATAFQFMFSRVPIRALRHSHLIFSSSLGPLPTALRLQTVYSMLLAAVALIVAAPVMLLVALAVKLTSRGPILYRQTRVGMHGRHFIIYKFRSMIADAEAKTGAVWASKNDPRITTIGGFLRRSRLDELPQLFNVLRREMSIVGPRPERPEFVGALTEVVPFYAQRHSVKPGITGWAQINYKYGDTVEDTMIKLEYDLYYIKNISMSLDFYIMFHTAKAMLASRFGQ
jgi:exopolysaccharide biosynthesis polyprenyl glycosylphosphotransferase